MIRAYRITDVRRAEADAMADLPDGELMQRAAHGLAEVVSTRLDQRAAGSDGTVVAIVGGGDNGGDALYACAELAAAGRRVAVIPVSARVHENGLAAARANGCAVLETDGAATSERLAGAEVVLDGVIGIGGRPGLSGAIQRLRDAVPESAYVIAVDLPSGTDPAGEIPGDSFFADETVTFGMAKPAHLLPAGELATGLLTFVDIGVAAPELPRVERLTTPDIARLWPVPGPFDDKYSRGVVGVVAGSERYPGAAVLAATAAVSAGAGMVRYVGPSTPTGLVRAAVPEAVIGAGRVQAYVVGPGISVEDRTSAGRAQQRAAVAALDSEVPCVVDAGGLDLITGKRSAPTLLTPHLGELARLAKRLRLRGLPRTGRGAGAWEAMVRAHPVTVGQAVADKVGASVLVKGAITVVIPPRSTGQPLRSQADGPPWLATAGAGDVLAGLAGVLLAGGLDPLDAGSLAASIHGRAAYVVNAGGPVRALDLALALGKTVADALGRS